MSESTSVRTQVDVQVGNLLRDDNLSLAVAESCTGGLISHKITNVPGSSDYFDRAVVSYSNRSKLELLDVQEDTLYEHGAVSKDVAAEMAKGVKDLAGTEVGLSTTGIAGPGGGTEEKPVGLVYVGIALEKTMRIKKFIFQGDRWENKESAAVKALESLVTFLAEEDD
ncbi:CinA family protein [Candidatus Bipolaricaulota bacterium]|nr:CinA family protein [Candidatus Bipolaricaulota bacterium]